MWRSSGLSEPVAVSVTKPRLELFRCHHCGRPSERMTRPMRIAGVFMNIPQFSIIQLPPGAEKFRCRGCGWINVFELIQGARGPVVDLQTVVT